MAENNDNLRQNGQRRRQRRGGPSAILAPGEKPQDFRRAVKDTLSYMGGYKLAVVFVILISALATIFETLGPKVMGHATTLLAQGAAARLNGTGGVDFAAVGKTLMITLMLYAIGAVAQWLQAFVMTNITQKIVYRMRRDISEKISRMPVG